MFHVINLETSEPVSSDAGPIVYATGKDAADAAKRLSEDTGKKHQPRRAVVDTAWRDRERARFEDGTYKNVPWAGVWWTLTSRAPRDHFPHASLKKPGLLAFSESPEKGAADIQTPIKPGAYLKRFYGDILLDAEIKEYAGLFAAAHSPVQVKFADTADEIERVYLNGPTSCMSHAASSYRSSVHPVRVYAAGDIAVAYLETDDGENITARALCRPDKQTYSRVYGDAPRLEAALDRLGYTREERCLQGARLARVEHSPGVFVCPYIDYIGNVRDDDDYLVIDRRGDISAEETNGLTQPTVTCERCGDAYVAENEGQYIEDVGESWCDHCVERHTFFCERTEQRCSGYSVTVRVGRHDQTWSEYAFECYGAECAATGRNYPADECTTLDGGTVWHDDYFAEHGFTCATCGAIRALDDMCADCEDGRPAIAGRDESADQHELAFQNADVPTPWHECARVGDQVLLQVQCGGLRPNIPYTVDRVDTGDPILCRYACASCTAEPIGCVL